MFTAVLMECNAYSVTALPVSKCHMHKLTYWIVSLQYVHRG